MNLRPPYQIRHRPNRPHHQRTPSSHGGKGGGPERSKPRPSNLMCLRSRRIQTTMTIRRLRHIFRWIALLGGCSDGSWRGALGIAQRQIPAQMEDEGELGRRPP